MAIAREYDRRSPQPGRRETDIALRQVLKYMRRALLAFAVVTMLVVGLGMHEVLNLIDGIQRSRIENCNHLNARFERAGVTLGEALDKTSNPKAFRAFLQPFLDSLKAENCRVAIKGDQ